MSFCSIIVRSDNYVSFRSSCKHHCNNEILCEFLRASQNLIRKAGVAMRFLRDFETQIGSLESHDRNSLISAYLEAINQKVGKVRNRSIPLALSIEVSSLCFHVDGDFGKASLHLPNDVDRFKTVQLESKIEIGDNRKVSPYSSSLKNFGRQMPLFSKWKNDLYSQHDNYDISILIDQAALRRF